MLAAACSLLAMFPAAASALTVSAPANVPLSAKVAISASSSDTTGFAMLMVDGAAVRFGVISPCEKLTFAAVPLTSGLHEVVAVLRTRAGLTCSPVLATRAWGPPATPRAPTHDGLYPKSVTIPVTIGSDTTTLAVLVDGKPFSTSKIARPSTLPLTLKLPAGAHRVELRASNPIALTSKSFILTRPTWPAPGYTTITSPFGWRYHPILHYWRLHAGTDIGAPEGAKAAAAASGTVVSAGWNSGGLGNFVLIDHGGGYETGYGHLSRIVVRKGQKVTMGQQIGCVGMTGLATGPHLHFEVRVNGTPVDPLGYL